MVLGTYKTVLYSKSCSCYYNHGIMKNNCLQGPPPPAKAPAAAPTAMASSSAAQQQAEPEVKIPPPPRQPSGQQQPRGKFFSIKWFMFNGGSQHDDMTCNMTHFMATQDSFLSMYLTLLLASHIHHISSIHIIPLLVGSLSSTCFLPSPGNQQSDPSHPSHPSHPGMESRHMPFPGFS